MTSEPTTVVIYGQEYTLRGGNDPEYVERIAAYVDARMQEVSQSSRQVTSLRVAILAALNITDELFRERDSTSSSVEDLTARADRLIQSLDENIEGLAEGAG